MKLTVVGIMAAGEIAACYRLYAAVARREAVRPALSPAAFAAAMSDPRLAKLVVHDGGGAPLALAVLTDDAAALARLGPEPRVSRHEAGGRVHYLGRALVRPDARSPEVFHAMRAAVVARLRAAPASLQSASR